MIGRACDLCGADDFEPLAHRDRRGQPLETAVCRTCGLIAHARIPTDAELTEYYAQTYRRDYHGEQAPSAYRVVREWRRGERLLAQLKDDLPPHARVLEIGSGIGCTVMNFALAGFEASGIEPGEGFCRYSREQLRADVSEGLLSDLPALPAYDAVLLVHVLEHLPSPTDALARIAKLLRPSGKLYVEVPNFARPHAAPGRQFHYAHIYNFTPATLRMLAAKTGFSIARAYTAPWDKDIGFLLAKNKQASLRVEGTSYTHSVDAFRRYSRLSYYLRLNYLSERALTLASHGLDRCFAKDRAAKILERCRAFADSRPATPQRRAA